MAGRGGTWQGSHWIRRARRLAIYARDEDRCVWCGNAAGVLSLDHLDLAAGHASANLVSSCLPCNGSRGDATVEDWLQTLDARGLGGGARARLAVAQAGAPDIAVGQARVLEPGDRARRRRACAAGRALGLQFSAESFVDRDDASQEEIPW